MLFALISLAIVANSVESCFSTNSSGSRFVKSGGVSNLAVPLETVQVSHQVDCVLRCMRQHGCVCCNVGPTDSVTKNRLCELFSGKNMSLAEGDEVSDGAMFFGKIIFVLMFKLGCDTKRYTVIG